MESELEVTPDRILALAQKIIAERQSLDYMTVAKAMVLQAAYLKEGVKRRFLLIH